MIEKIMDWAKGVDKFVLLIFCTFSLTGTISIFTKNTIYVNSNFLIIFICCFFNKKFKIYHSIIYISLSYVLGKILFISSSYSRYRLGYWLFVDRPGEEINYYYYWFLFYFFKFLYLFFVLSYSIIFPLVAVFLYKKFIKIINKKNCK